MKTLNHVEWKTAADPGFLISQIKSGGGGANIKGGEWR